MHLPGGRERYRIQAPASHSFILVICVFSQIQRQQRTDTPILPVATEQVGGVICRVEPVKHTITDVTLVIFNNQSGKEEDCCN